MSEGQTKAGNQEFKSLNVIENCEKLTNQSTFKSIHKQGECTYKDIVGHCETTKAFTSSKIMLHQSMRKHQADPEYVERLKMCVSRLSTEIKDTQNCVINSYNPGSICDELIARRSVKIYLHFHFRSWLT